MLFVGYKINEATACKLAVGIFVAGYLLGILTGKEYIKKIQSIIKPPVEPVKPKYASANIY
jgi:hypothetical protein